MKANRLIAGLMAVALLAGLVPAGAAGTGSGGAVVTATSAFQDIADPAVADAAEILRLLGVVEGTGSGFHPAGTLTRAEFCKMTVEIMAKGDQEPSNRNRTIFNDVGPTHWARGYINLASSIPLGGSSGSDTDSGKGTDTASSERLITGVGNGNFEPNTKITFGSAVAILSRVLGYTSADVSIGTNWYDGYLSVARLSGLTDGLTLAGDAAITRGQAALLFKNLIFTKGKGSSTIFLTTTLGGKLTENTILLETNATAADGSTGAIKTPENLYKTERVGITAELAGARGKLVLDKDEKVLAFQPDKNDTVRRTSVLGSVQANYVPVPGDEKLDVKLTTAVWKDGKATTYEAVWTSLRTGTPLVFCYSAVGKLDYIYMPGEAFGAEISAMVAKSKPTGTTNPFVSLVGGDKDYVIYKNGLIATVEDLRQYDVATYDKSSKILNVSDLRLTGLYENVYPNVSAPSKVTIMGAELTVLPSAMTDLSSFKLGEKVTLLLTSTGQIAGAVNATVAQSTAVGAAKMTDKQATVELLDGIVTLKGDTMYSADTAAGFNGQLVNVSSTKAGYLSLSPITGSGDIFKLDVATGTIGGKALAENVKIYEQAGNGVLTKILLEDITRNAVPTSKITYVGYDYAGRVSYLVLNDATGDRYTYGFSKFVAATASESDTWNFSNATIQVTNENGGKGLGPLECGTLFESDKYIGIAATLDGKKLAASVELQPITGVRRTAFNLEDKLVTTPSMILPVATKVHSYNKSSNKWLAEGIDGLKEALAFSDSITLYYDKAPEDGGKVRIVVVE